MGIDKDNEETTAAAELRRRAEKKLKTKSAEASSPRTEAETRRLIHELDVHRVELEIQNAELRAARDAAASAMEMYAEFYDFAPVGYFTLERDGTVREANLTGAAYLGLVRSRLIGQRFNSFLTREERPGFAAFIEQLFASGAKGSCEALLLREILPPLPTQIVAQANPAGGGCRLVVVDLSERKEMEKELRSARDKLFERTMAAEKANRSKSLFLANMSHELRTPMTGVLGMLDVALDGPLDPQQRDCIETAGRSARSLLQILNDILDITRIEEGKLSIIEKEFSLAASMHLAVDILIPEARRKGIELVLTMADDLPEGVIGDQLRLRQILTNLLGNAVKFTEEGKVEVMVTAGGMTASDRREFTFTVTDTGIGIPAGKQDLLFIPFSQVDNSHSRSHGGTGLGLAICREIVTRMGGTISCESQEGKGSSFSFTLPLCEAGRVCGEIPCSVSPEAEPVRHRSRLLIAEDDQITRKVMGLMLKNLEFDFDFAINGRQVVEMWEKGGHDLIIMDVQMPVMDGFEATAVIRGKERQRGGHVPILAMTAHALREDEERCLAAGMDGYVSKPIDFRKCLEVMREMIKNKGEG